MKKIIVTGGSGFIGSNLINFLIRKFTRLLPIKPDPPVTMIFFIYFKDLYAQCDKLVKELSFKIKYYY